MKTFFGFLLAAIVCSAAALALAYQFPDRVPEAIRPYVLQVVALGRLPPLSFEANAAPPPQQAAAPPAGQGRGPAGPPGQGGGPPGRGGPGGGPPRPAAVEAAPVKVDTVRVTITSVGSMLANEQVAISSEIAGRVADISFEEGRPVRVGDQLAALDDALLKAEVSTAEATLRLAETNFQRADTLLRQNAGTQRARDEATSALETAKAALDLGRAKLDKSIIRAPFSGILGLRQVSVGEFVSAGDTIVTLQSIDPMKVDFRISETFLSAARVGQKLQIALDALPGQTFEGEVYAIDPQVDINGRSIKLRARVPNPNGVLRPGLFARIDIVAVSRERAMLVPESAIVATGDRRFVYVIRDGKAARVPVSIGQRVSGTVEVREGLKEGDMVVTAGQQRLRDGSPVEIVAAAVRS